MIPRDSVQTAATKAHSAAAPIPVCYSRSGQRMHEMLLDVHHVGTRCGVTAHRPFLEKLVHSLSTSLRRNDTKCKVHLCPSLWHLHARLRSEALTRTIIIRNARLQAAMASWSSRPITSSRGIYQLNLRESFIKSKHERQVCYPVPPMQPHPSVELSAD